MLNVALIRYVLFCIEWCTVKSLRTNNLFVVISSQLEDEDGSSISSTDLLPDLKVVCDSKQGERQDVAIVNMHGK